MHPKGIHGRSTRRGCQEFPGEDTGWRALSCSLCRKRKSYILKKGLETKVIWF